MIGGRSVAFKETGSVVLTVDELSEDQKIQVAEAVRKKREELERKKENPYLDPSKNPMIKTNPE